MRGFFFTWWGALLTLICLVHYARRRQSTQNYWLWLILMGGWIGALAYIFVEIVPDLGWDQPFRSYFVHRKKIEQMEAAVHDNPSPGNYEELGMALLDDKQYARARECYDKAITPRTNHTDVFYRRALCALAMNDHAIALPDLERVVQSEPAYDFQRAPGLLANVYAELGQNDKADALFTKTLQSSTLSETQCNYAAFLLKQQRRDEAKQWASEVTHKKKSLPNYNRRLDNKWISKANGILKEIG